jgi:hypothetical protein
MSVKSEIISINDIDYYNTLHLKELDPVYFYGCTKMTRSIIDKKNIPDDSYEYATFNVCKNEWTIYDKTNKIPPKAGLFITKEWADTNIPKLKPIVEKIIIKPKRNSNRDNDIIDKIDNKYSEAPELLDLDDNEKFKDEENNIINIETRGTRSCDGVYFKVKDVSVNFEMPSLYSVLIDERKAYLINRDYKYFLCKTIASVEKKENKNNKVSKELFLTYRGILRVLFVSKSGKVDRFIKWATDTLFTVQMGTKDQKYNLTSKVLGVTANVVREVFRASATTLPCVYLFTLGDVKNLRESMNIDDKYSDNMIVCRYGHTDDLSRRIYEHNKTFGRLEGTDFKLKYYSYVDPQYNSSAETDIKDYFETLNVLFAYENNAELVIIDPKLFKKIEKQYKQISNEYAGHVKDLIKHIEHLKTEIKISMLEKENEILNKDKKILELEKNIEIEKKSLEIEKLKNQLLVAKRK